MVNAQWDFNGCKGDRARVKAVRAQVFALEIGFEAGEQADMKVSRATEVSAGLTISIIKESHLRSCDGFAR